MERERLGQRPSKQLPREGFQRQQQERGVRVKGPLAQEEAEGEATATEACYSVQTEGLRRRGRRRRGRHKNWLLSLAVLLACNSCHSTGGRSRALPPCVVAWSPSSSSPAPLFRKWRDAAATAEARTAAGGDRNGYRFIRRGDLGSRRRRRGRGCAGGDSMTIASAPFGVGGCADHTTSASSTVFAAAAFFSSAIKSTSAFPSSLYGRQQSRRRVRSDSRLFLGLNGDGGNGDNSGSNGNDRKTKKSKSEAETTVFAAAVSSVAASEVEIETDELEKLRSENEELRRALRDAEAEKEGLLLMQEQIIQHLHVGGGNNGVVNKIVLETFEGEGKLRRAAEEAEAAAAAMAANLEHGHIHHHDVVTADDEDFSNPSSSLTLTGEEMIVYGNDEQSGGKRIQQQQQQGEDAEDDSLWCDTLDGDTCPVEPAVSFGEALRDRAYWLVGLLVLQSFSGIILSYNEALLANHPVIVYFLTMLVGAGGNAGNQASVRVIRGLALGTLNDRTRNQFLLREFKMSLALSVILSLTGFLRAAAFRTPPLETVAVTAALGLIVLSSVCLGAVLPLVLQSLKIDPAHSSTTIQVIMDILGVVLAVVVSNVVLDSPLGGFLLSRLGM